MATRQKRATLIISGLVLIAMTGCMKKIPDQAQSAAAEWLALVDDGKYEASWSSSSAFFKNAVSVEQWGKMMGAYRKPLGKVGARKLFFSKEVKKLPGAPDADYCLLIYRTSFENKKSSVETATFMLENGSWRAAGYFIK